jgi:hypothetical protein
MNTNLALSYINILLFIIFVLFLGQPEHVVLIHACTALSGTLIANQLYSKDSTMSYDKFMIYDLYVHWVPALMSIAMVDFSLVGTRQYIFAFMYPILYLCFRLYKDNKGWTNIKPENPIEHLKKMYPYADIKTYLLYYVILIGLYFSMGSRSS